MKHEYEIEMRHIIKQLEIIWQALPESEHAKLLDLAKALRGHIQVRQTVQRLDVAIVTSTLAFMLSTLLEGTLDQLTETQTRSE